MATRDLRLQAAQKAIDSIGLGFDMTQCLDFDNCKSGSRLIRIKEEHCRDLDIPGGVSISNVPESIICVTGETELRIRTGVLSLKEMLEHSSQEMSLGGETPSGHFYASFGLSGRSIKDLATITSLGYDGWFIKRYAIELDMYRNQGELEDHVKDAMPTSWDTEALASCGEHGREGCIIC